ncbi:MAG: aldo/keto reductase [Chitinophagaceae bacterium]
MNYHMLGRSSLSVSEIGFGCMSLEDTEQANILLLNQALDRGINYFDTADIYQNGLNEKTLGKAFLTRRHEMIIASKAGNVLRKVGSGLDWNASKKHILFAVSESLRRLQTDYIDLYQLHGGTMDDPIDETIEAFEILQKQGKIRYYGISSIRPTVINEYVRRSNIVSVMMQYGLLDRRPEETCLPLLQQHSIGVLARGSLAKGLLVNKPPKSFLDYSEHEVKKAAAVVKMVSGPQRSASQTTIQFALANRAIASAVVGIRTLQQLEEAVETANTPQLTTNEFKTLSGCLPVNYYDQHR